MGKTAKEIWEQHGGDLMEVCSALEELALADRIIAIRQRPQVYRDGWPIWKANSGRSVNNHTVAHDWDDPVDHQVELVPVGPRFTWSCRCGATSVKGKSWEKTEAQRYADRHANKFS